MKFCVYIFVFYVILHVKCSHEFIATKEWQEIPEGLAVPGGLHYRINLETGKNIIL